jgi:hypothetical protein
VLPGPDALMMAGPAVVDEMLTLALPGATRVELLAVTVPPAMVPRLAEKDTVWPTGDGISVQLAVTVGVLHAPVRGISGGDAAIPTQPGFEIPSAKLALLMVSACVALPPAAVAVIRSLPGAVALTVAVNWPELLVTPVAGVIVFTFCEATVTVAFGIAVPAESLTVNVSGVVAPAARELLPLIVTVVPTTATLLEALAASAVAVTAIVRFALLLPRLSWAVTRPFASDTPLALMLFTNAVTSVALENVTVLPLTACLVALSTTAVRATAFAPDEGICGLLASSSIDAAGVPPGAAGPAPAPAPAAAALDGGVPAPPEPQPASTASVAARKSDAESLEIPWLKKFLGK